jgi:glycosyltransferase involved in cell wall biosynthesis
MKILVVSISAPPRNSPESLQTGRYIKYLAGKHKVTLVTAESPGGWEPVDETLLDYLNNIHKTISLKLWPRKLVDFIRVFFPSLLIPDEYFYLQKKYRHVADEIGDKPDIIISRSAPFSSALLALQLSKAWNAPWIMHLSDPWADNPFSRFNKNQHRKNQKLEKSCIEAANLVTLTSIKTINWFQKKYPLLTHKFRLLPNVYDDEQLLAPDNGPEDKIRFVFTGRLYGNRKIHPFLEAAEQVARAHKEWEEKSEIILAGFFDEENQQRIKMSNLKNIVIQGAVSGKQALELQKKASVLLSVDALEADERYDLFFPSKLLDYMAAGRPVLAIARRGSTTYEIVEGKIGKCFCPENINELPCFLKQIVMGQTAGSFSPGTQNAIGDYAASVNAGKLEKWIKEILDATKSTA